MTIYYTRAKCIIRLSISNYDLRPQKYYIILNKNKLLNLSYLIFISLQCIILKKKALGITHALCNRCYLYDSNNYNLEFIFLQPTCIIFNISGYFNEMKYNNATLKIMLIIWTNLMLWKGQITLLTHFTTLYRDHVFCNHFAIMNVTFVPLPGFFLVKLALKLKAVIWQPSR